MKKMNFFEIFKIKMIIDCRIKIKKIESFFDRSKLPPIH